MKREAYLVSVRPSIMLKLSYWFQTFQGQSDSILLQLCAMKTISKIHHIFLKKNSVKIHLATEHLYSTIYFNHLSICLLYSLFPFICLVFFTCVCYYDLSLEWPFVNPNRYWYILPHMYVCIYLWKGISMYMMFRYIYVLCKHVFINIMCNWFQRKCIIDYTLQAYCVFIYR